MTTQKRAAALIENWKKIPDYENRSKDPLYNLVRRALAEKLLEKPGTPRVPGGILSNVYEWDLLPAWMQKTIFTEFFHKASGWWGDRDFEAAKRICLSKLRALDGTLFEHLERRRIDRLLGTR